MNKETTNSHNVAAFLLFLLIIPCIVIFVNNEAAFVFALLIIAGLAFACLFVKEGFIANDKGITFWKWWKLKYHFDYSSIHSIDIKVKLHRIGKSSSTFRPVYTMKMVTDNGKFTFMDTPPDFYDRSVCKNPDKINVILENSDLMRLKEYIEEHKS